LAKRLFLVLCLVCLFVAKHQETTKQTVGREKAQKAQKKKDGVYARHHAAL